MLYILGGATTLNVTTDVWALDLGSQKWSRLAKPVVDRHGAGYAQGRAGKLWLYGGVDQTGAVLRHVSVFDAAKRTYTDFAHSAPNASLAVPTAGVAVAVSPSEEWLHVFGGSLGSANGALSIRTKALPSRDPVAPMCSNNVASWHIQKNEWQVFPAQAHGPTGRDGATLLEHDGELIVFGGGCNATEADVGVWRFDYRNGTWTVDTPRGTARPPARRDHLAALDATEPNPSLLIFGGVHAGGHYLNDVWAYDLVNHTWTQLHALKPPPPRASSAGVYALGRCASASCRHFARA